MPAARRTNDILTVWKADEPSVPSRPSTPPQLPEHNPYNFSHEQFEDYFGAGNVTRHHFRSDDGRFTYASATFRSPTRPTPLAHRRGETMPATDPLAPLFTNLNALFQGLAASGSPTSQPAGNGQSGSTNGAQQTPYERVRHEPTELPLSTVDE